MFVTMLKDTKQKTFVRNGIPPQGWQLGVVKIRHPDLNFTKEEEMWDYTDIMWEFLLMYFIQIKGSSTLAMHEKQT